MVLAPDGSRVIVGGSFTALSGVDAYGMGSISTTERDPAVGREPDDPRSPAANGAITSLRTDGKQIYGTGYCLRRPDGQLRGHVRGRPDDRQHQLAQRLPRRHLRRAADRPGPLQRQPRARLHDDRRLPRHQPARPLAARARRRPSHPTGTNTGPDTYGWNYTGLPDSDASCTGSRDLGRHLHRSGPGGWSLAGNSNYVAIGGEFPNVNGVGPAGPGPVCGVVQRAQQGRAALRHEPGSADPGHDGDLARRRAPRGSASAPRGTRTTSP